MNIEMIEKSTTRSYVCHGATLECSNGSLPCKLQLPIGHGVYLRDKKQANIDDYKSMFNVLPFGICSVTGNPCVPAIVMKWINGKEDVIIESDLALLNISVNVCSLGGLITIIDDGQL